MHLEDIYGQIFIFLVDRLGLGKNVPLELFKLGVKKKTGDERSISFRKDVWIGNDKIARILYSRLFTFKKSRILLTL